MKPYTNRAGEPAEPLLPHFQAPAGGCYGLSGTYYEGGQFLPKSERPTGASFVRTVPTEAQAAYLARKDAEMAAFRERVRLNALRPDTQFLVAWIESQGRPVLHVRPHQSHYWMDARYEGNYRHLLRPEHAAELQTMIEAGCARRHFDWGSDFLEKMHAELTEYGKCPNDLSDRQYQVLAEIYCKAHGRRGSRAFGAAWQAFVDATLPDDE